MSNQFNRILRLIERVKPQISQKIDSIVNNPKSLNVREKADTSVVTILDLFISDLIEKEINSTFPEVNFYSEENQKSFEFPVCILDPIDGTKELVEGVDEYAVSFGIYYSKNFEDPRNFSWIYNPRTGFEIHNLLLVDIAPRSCGQVLTLISRTEAKMGLFPKETEELAYKAVGSIAYKLGLLAAGQCDQVISKRDKNVWDIAAGTHLCLLQGISFKSSSELDCEIHKEKYIADLYWGRIRK